MKFLPLLVPALVTVAAGCVVAPPTDANAVPAVHKQASFDLSCPQDQLQITELSHNKYGAKGCHRQASYFVESCGPGRGECVVTMASPVTSTYD